MQSDDILARSLARDFVVFVVLPCALLMGVAYLCTVYIAPTPYADVKLQSGVLYVSARRFETHGLETLAEKEQANTLSSWDASSAQRNVTVLVHGYNTQDNQIASYFAALVSDLNADARYKGSIIVFDWPTVGIPHDELPASQRLQRDLHMAVENTWSQPAYELTMYGIDQRRAESIGASTFLSLLEHLSEDGSRTINVVAHSMGCHLLEQAMKQRPDAFSRVASMIWLAPDVDQTVLDEPAFRSAVDRLGHGLSVHYANTDAILTRLSEIANPAPRLGAWGASRTSQPHPKLEFIDMTNELGTNNVHTGYLLRGSASTKLIIKAIAEER